MPAAEAASLRLTAYRNLLAPREGDARAIRELWKSLRSDERKAAEIAAPTVAALARAEAPEDARKIALAVLDGGYDDATVEAYGGMAALPARQRLEQLERWRTRYGDRPKLLEMLGRVCASERLWGKAEAYLLGSLAAGDTVSARVALAQLYESIDRPKEAALQFQLAARLALGERPPLPKPATPAGSLAAGSMHGGDAGNPEASAFPTTTALRGTLPGSAAVGAAAAAAGAAGVATADSNDPDEAAAATAGDVGAVPAIARPDRQDLQDRTPAAEPVDTGSTLPAPPSDAPSAVDLETGTGDELGLVGRKE
jgi:HemY protein